MFETAANVTNKTRYFFCPLTPAIVMFCVKAPRELRKVNSQHPSTATSDCWGNVSVLVGMKARVCGFSSNAILCKKHCDELSYFNKVSCCFPFRDSENACKGCLVQCPQRFFSAFDATKTVHHVGPMICEGHLVLADEDDRICQMDEYISPTKVSVGTT